jgi:hypothetical protein
MATTTSNNGTKPKVDLLLNQPVRIKLLKPTPYIGENAHGKFYLYNVTSEEGMEMAYFATESVHNLIQVNQLKAGSMIQLTKRTKGTEFAIVGQVVPETLPAIASEATTDNLRAIMLQCVIDSAEIVKSSGVQLNNEDLVRIGITLFIQRAKAA